MMRRALMMLIVLATARSVQGQDDMSKATIYFANPATAANVLPISDVTIDSIAKLTIGVANVSGTVKIEMVRDGKLVFSASPKASKNGIAILGIGAYGWKVDSYEVKVNGQQLAAFKVRAAIPPAGETIPPPPVTGVTPSLATTIVQAGAPVIVEEGFPFYIHTIGLNLPGLPVLPAHNFDFDWQINSVVRFNSARGRCYSAILSAGTYLGHLTVTYPVTGAKCEIPLSIVVVPTVRKSVTASTFAQLKAGLETANTDVSVTNDIELIGGINAANMTRLFGNGHRLSASAAVKTCISQPKGRDGFVLDGAVVDCVNDFFAPSGTRPAIRNCVVNHAWHFVLANGDPDGLLIEDNYTRDEKSIEKYMGWLGNTRYFVVRGNWVDNAIIEHCFRGGGVCGAFDRNWLVNLDEKGPDFDKGTITMHTAKDVSVDLCRASRGGEGDNFGGDMATGPLQQAGNDGQSAERISFTRCFVEKGAGILIRAGTYGARIEDCKTTFTGRNCFGLSGSQNVAGLKPASDVRVINSGVGSDPTPPWSNKRVAA
jgi:hypothetical protein